VVLYNRTFDGTCDMCLNGCEILCRNGGIMGVNTNGGFAQYIAASEKNVFKIPDNVQWDVAASLCYDYYNTISCIKRSVTKIK
jgi:D-arabinose 1-dehydrogenase-like Zn-dependent alcohol dehydrogenase